MADIRAQITRAREAANDIAETASGKFRDTTEKTRASAGDLIQTGLERASDARDKAGEAYAGARDRTQRAAARANEIVQQHPVTAVAGAVAAGAVIAWMFPKSRAVVKALPGLAATAGTRVVEAALAAKAAAVETAENLKTNAGDALNGAGESAKGVAASARKAAASADLGSRTSRLADGLVSLVASSVDSFSEALKARLPKG